MARTWKQFPRVKESISLSLALLYPNLPPCPSHFPTSSVFIIQFLYCFLDLEFFLKMEARERGSMSSSIGNSAELEGNLTLSDRLKVFKGSTFDPDAYVTSKCQRMNEKVFFLLLISALLSCVCTLCHLESARYCCWCVFVYRRQGICLLTSLN